MYPGFLIGLLLIGLPQLSSDATQTVIVLFPLMALGLVRLFANTVWSLVSTKSGNQEDVRSWPLAAVTFRRF